MYFFKNNQKSFATVLLIFFCFSLTSGLLYPKKTEAIFCSNCATVWDQITQIVRDAVEFAWKKKFELFKWAWDEDQTLMRIAMAKFRKLLLDTITNEIITWIQGGGKPKFVSDWKSFLTDIGDQAGGQVLEQMLGPDVMNSLCNPNWAPHIYIGLNTPQRFKNTTKCTLSDIGVAWNDYMNDFGNGGWDAWIKIAENQNNPYGVYLITMEEMFIKEEEAEEAAKNEAMAGGGFRNDKVCREVISRNGSKSGTWKEEDIPNGYTCARWETRTPAQTIGEGFSKATYSAVDWLMSNEEWESYMVAITDALINRLINDGVAALTSDDISSSGDASAIENSGLYDGTPSFEFNQAAVEAAIASGSNGDSSTSQTTGGSTKPIAKFDVNPKGIIQITEGIFFTLDPSDSKDNDSSNQIISYEWDFDGDGIYDWWATDEDKNGTFEKIVEGAGITTPGGDFSIQIPSDAKPGELQIKYKSATQKTIILRVQDNEELYDTETKKIIVNFSSTGGGGTSDDSDDSGSNSGSDGPPGGGGGGVTNI